MKTTFAGFEAVNSLEELVVGGDEKQKRMRSDPHIPDLFAVAPGVEISNTTAYKNGEIILQDKASCFPAYLLLGEGWGNGGDLVDGCAAPGNKTTHMASLLEPGKKPKSHIFSMDASAVRAKTLQKMVSTAGADNLVTVLPGQDFLALDPQDPRFENVTGLLLDPSCSGSGIIGRDDVPELILPAGKPTGNQNQNPSKKRKRSGAQPQNPPPQSSNSTSSTNPTSENDLPPAEITRDRLAKLSNIQTLIVTHALSFPSARKVTYSTCSIHLLENESVVARILESEVAKRRGWRVLRRDEQPVGLRNWKSRGVKREKNSSADNGNGDGNGHGNGHGKGEGEGEDTVGLSEDELQGCMRCWPGDEEGTGGFFVVGFVRDENHSTSKLEVREEDQDDTAEDDSDDQEWEGFSD